MKRLIMRALGCHSAADDDGPRFGDAKGNNANEDGKGKYAEVKGLKMYYEIHGTGRPLVLLHGAFG